VAGSLGGENFFKLTAQTGWDSLAKSVAEVGDKQM
jgi:hypothetical protein